MNKLLKSSIAVVLVFTLAGCWTVAQWISVAIADLPVLTQIALNIATLSGGASPADQAEVTKVSQAVTTGVAAIQTAYNEYKATPSATTLAKITTAITAIQSNLPALLQAAHISDPALTAKVTSAVGIVLSTVEAFAQLIPQPTPAGGLKKAAKKATLPVPSPDDLRKQWQDISGVPLPAIK